ncbi:MAG: deoxyribonuclease IV [Gemmatimonadaceae bacterium]
MPHLIGAHTIDVGGIHMAARRAGRAGMRALQIFTAIPKFYNEKVSVKPERAARFREALRAADIAPENVVAHAAYVLNVASPEEAKWERASLGLMKELDRANTLGIGAVCFHPGANPDKADGVRRIAKAITRAIETVASDTTRLLVENTAGAGNTIARTAEEVASILALVPASLRGRTGYGLDTCHLYSSGHDIAMSEDALRVVLDEFERMCGEPPAFFHLNDSEGALGTNKDRHALIGEGQIGEAPFAWLLRDRRSRGVPLVLETPQKDYEPAEDDDAPDAYDVRMVRLLERLAAG